MYISYTWYSIFSYILLAVISVVECRLSVRKQMLKITINTPLTGRSSLMLYQRHLGFTLNCNMMLISITMLCKVVMLDIIASLISVL